MIKRFLLFCCILSSFAYAQSGLDSLSHIDYQALHQANLNDVWGYVDEFGNEYAIVGTSKGTSIVNVTNPTNPIEVFWYPGTESIWRDPCVYGNYAYVTTEAEDGLLIIDLSPLPSSNVLPTTIYTGPLGNAWQSAHTCFIDENGYAYIFGSNRGNGGAIILDVHTNPMNPIEVGTFDNWYVHDGFVRNDTMYLAHIGDGFFSLVDCFDKANPVLLGTKTTPNNFTHNIWPNSSGQFVYTTDEISGAYIAAYDISDPLNIVEVDRIQNSPSQGVPPHNTHVRGNYLVTSYYSDGVVIHDITHPYNMIRIASYDTYPSQTTGYDGCWGVYPFLPSGTILASDITQGLFILGPTYAQAAYLEGVVTDAATGLPLNNVKVKIEAHDQADFSSNSGFYATGINQFGNFTVSYSKVGYFPQTQIVLLSQGVITNQNIQLVPIPPYTLTVNVVEAGTANPISNAQILFDGSLIEHNGLTNAIGQEVMTLYYQEVYDISVGKWGYKTNCWSQQIDQATGTLTVELEKGYYDDFTFDFGWNISGNAVTGAWQRGDPTTTNGGSAPGIDADFDCGVTAYVTGNDPAMNADVDDVDGGETVLISPVFDLTTYSDPHVNFARWFFCLHGNPPDDTLKIFISNGINTVLMDQTGSVEADFYKWIFKSIRVLDFIPVTSSMQITVRVSDLDPNVNITEAGFDYFSITNASVLSSEEHLPIEVNIFPNPVHEILFVKGLDFGETYKLISTSGEVLIKGQIQMETEEIDMQGLDSGLYFLICGDKHLKVMKV